jgi:hypothetical protein
MDIQRDNSYVENLYWEIQSKYITEKTKITKQLRNVENT